jgi:P-type Ca2+ transporter type 2C
MQGNTVTILKMGNPVSIAEDDLSKGDIVLVQAGDLVPADLKLIETRGLEIDDWELTGEIVPTEKRVNGEDVYLYRGSTVTRGSGMGVVVATGTETEYGRILKQSQVLQSSKPPILVRSKYFILPVLLLPPLLISWSHHSNHAFVCELGAAMALALVLLQNDELFGYILVSRGARRIERQNIRIRNMAALDVIPHLDLVCLDKTGVLTTRDVSVSQIHYMSEMHAAAPLGSPDEETVNLTAIACALCNDVFVLDKLSTANPIDRALIATALRNGVDIHEAALKYKRIYDKPFNSEDRYMVAGFELDGRKLYFAKGDPEVVWKMCRSYTTESGAVKEIDWAFLQSLRMHIEAINQAGDMAIGLAYGSGILDTPPLGYTFLCLLQLENPLEPGVPDVVARLERARIRTIMLTGDRPEVAMEVARKARIGRYLEYCLTGKQMVGMALSDVARQADYVSIFARLLPSQKAVLLRLFQQTYHCVAMVGDGANDTLALKAANVAISFVKNSSPMARRVSDILISDLSDLLTVIQEATAIQWQVGQLLLFRDLMVTAVLIAWYAWNLQSVFSMTFGIGGAT